MVRPMRAPAEEATPGAAEVARGERFAFGENWRRFLEVLDERSISRAERSLQQMLGLDSLEGRRFLDVGCGSGLFSLAARRLGADRVHSFDFDAESVACARELRRRYFEDDPRWTIGQGSVLDEQFVAGLGEWDITYSWGVLHHTGDMWRALELAAGTVRPGGSLFVSIYNDQRGVSRFWGHVKRTYNRLPEGARVPFTVLVMAPHQLLSFLRSVASGRPMAFVRSWTDYGSERGMSRWRDMVDWIGGYPFEVAKPDDVFRFFRGRGFQLEGLTTRGAGSGCNEYVFTRSGTSSG